MSKKRIDDWIAPAVEILKDTGIVQNGKVDSAYRGQIASFGAAVVMGSMKAAVAFFSQQGSSKVHRELLLPAMYRLVTGSTENVKPADIFRYICNNDNTETRNAFLDAAVALKLAMNFYDMGREGSKNEKSEPAVQ
jgi:CRISPR-associated protein Cmr5